MFTFLLVSFWSLSGLLDPLFELVARPLKLRLALGAFCSHPKAFYSL